MYRIQEPPNALQIELTEGCNLYCDFCGLQGIRTHKVKNFKFMNFDTLNTLAKQIKEAKWNPRVEFAMHGEPTMNENIIEFIRVFRILNPTLSIMITSNGGGLLRNPGPSKNIRALFDAGLNILALDDYKNIGIIPRIRKSLEEQKLEGIEIYEYPENPSGNPHIRAKSGKRMVSFIEDISSSNKGTHATLNNHAGSGSPPNESAKGKRCAKPFREISVRWDGSVAICCNDWRGYYKCGNINNTPIQEIWNGPEFGAARVSLYHGMRDFGPCNGCDARSYRVGLLPDKLGKESLPLPDQQVKDDITKALEGDPYTVPVKRPWE
jgi:radical SAM protein with 4Fe4S-binding SPASM domain